MFVVIRNKRPSSDSSIQTRRTTYLAHTCFQSWTPASSGEPKKKSKWNHNHKTHHPAALVRLTRSISVTSITQCLTKISIRFDCFLRKIQRKLNNDDIRRCKYLPLSCEERRGTNCRGVTAIYDPFKNHFSFHCRRRIRPCLPACPNLGNPSHLPLLLLEEKYETVFREKEINLIWLPDATTLRQKSGKNLPNSVHFCSSSLCREARYVGGKLGMMASLI